MTQPWPFTDGGWSRERAHFPEAPDRGAGTAHQESSVWKSAGGLEVGPGAGIGWEACLA